MQLTNLKTNFLGKNIKYFKELDSTQSEIWRMIDSKVIKNGMLVIADIQTNGKGTHGRIWHTDESNNIAFSIYVETNCCIYKLENITKEIAEILRDIIFDKYNIHLAIKEPNDIMFENKKIGGILTECKISSEISKFIVCGIGINTNKCYFPDDIKDIATSIKKEFNVEINNEEIIEEFCNRFEKCIMRRVRQ